MAIDPIVSPESTPRFPPDPADPVPARGFDFVHHLVDIINPLQHIPIISTIYRQMTGDEIAPAARVAGGGLFAGPIGLVAATVNVIIDGVTGREAGEHVVAMFTGDDPADQMAAIRAAASPAGPATALGAPRAPMPLPIGWLATALTEADAIQATAASGQPIVQPTAPPWIADAILNTVDKYHDLARERKDQSSEGDTVDAE